MPDSHLYFAPDFMSDGEIGRHFRLPPTLLGSIRRFGIKKAVRGSYYAARYADAVFHCMKCIIWDKTPHLNYCAYSWNKGSLIDYPTYGSYHAQPASTCFSYDILALAAPEVVDSRVAQHHFGTKSLPPVETILDSGNEDTP